MGWARVRELLFARHLLATNTVGFGLLMGVGDGLMQGLERCWNKNQKTDLPRTGRMLTVGVVMGPFNHFWYGFLDHRLPGIRASVVVSKILLDQIIGSPFFSVTFFLGAGALEGRALSNSWREFTEKFWDVYKADWCFWPAVQTVNFIFLPPQLRVMYVAVATVGWDAFLSYMKHKESKGYDDQNQISSNTNPTGPGR